MHSSAALTTVLGLCVLFLSTQTTNIIQTLADGDIQNLSKEAKYANIHIRPAIPSDAPQLRALIQELADHHDMSDALRIGAEQIAKDMTAGRFHAVVAMDREVLAAYAIYYLPSSSEDGKILFLEDLYVQKAYRRHKLGARSMQELTKIAQAQGLTLIDWDVARTNTGAVRFYQKLNGLEDTTDGKDKGPTERKIMWRLPVEQFGHVETVAKQNPVNVEVLLDEPGRIGEALAQRLAKQWLEFVAENQGGIVDGKTHRKKHLSAVKLAQELQNGQLGVLLVKNTNKENGPAGDDDDDDDLLAMALFHRKAYSTWTGPFVVLEQFYVNDPKRDDKKVPRIMVTKNDAGVTHDFRWLHRKCEQIGTAMVAELVKMARALNSVRIQWTGTPQNFEFNQCHNAGFYETLNAINLTEKEDWLIYRWHFQQQQQGPFDDQPAVIQPATIQTEAGEEICFANNLGENQWIDENGQQLLGPIFANNQADTTVNARAAQPFTQNQQAAAATMCRGKKMLFYYEVEMLSTRLNLDTSVAIGLCPADYPLTHTLIGERENSFAVSTGGFFRFFPNKYWVNFLPKTVLEDDVLGCGVLTNADGKYAQLFFTINGERAGPEFPLNQVNVAALYPVISVHGRGVTKTNFGAQKFRYDLASYTPNLNGGLSAEQLAAVQPFYTKVQKNGICVAENPMENRWIDANKAMVFGPVFSHIGKEYTQLRAAHPFARTEPFKCRETNKLFYYEVTVLSAKGSPATVSVGISPKTYAKNSKSVAFSCETGEFCQNRAAMVYKYTPRMMAKGDVVGCGLLASVDRKFVELFFTLNGKRVGYDVALNNLAVDMYPLVTVWANSVTKTNFGGEQFRYDLTAYVPMSVAKMPINNSDNQWIGWEGKEMGLIVAKEFRGFRTVRGEHPISAQVSPGNIYYFETKILSTQDTIHIGLCDGDFPLENNFLLRIGDRKNSYAISSYAVYTANGKRDPSVKVPFYGSGDVVGCGMRTDAHGKYVTLFFTLNGKLIGKQIPLNNEVDVPLYPAVSLWGHSKIKGNFGTEKFAFDLATYETAVESLLQESNTGTTGLNSVANSNNQPTHEEENVKKTNENGKNAVELKAEIMPEMPSKTADENNRAQTNPVKPKKQNKLMSIINSIFSSRIGSKIGRKKNKWASKKAAKKN